MFNKNNTWVKLDEYRIFDNSLWLILDQSNPLSELIEIQGLKFISTDKEGRSFYKSIKPEKNKIIQHYGTEIGSEIPYLYIGEEKIWD